MVGAGRQILLVHWRPEEAADRISALEDAGDRVEVYADQAHKGLARYRAEPPDVALISLERLPSHGREIAQWFGATKAVCHVPLVFVGGDPEKVDVARAQFPDREFCAWRGVRGAMQRAIRRRAGVTPDAAARQRAATAVCSTKELWQKLGIDAGARVAVLGRAATDLRVSLGPGLPADVQFTTQARGAADVVLVFPASVADLATRWPKAVAMLRAAAPRIWLAWPKLRRGQRSGDAGPITQDLLRGFGADQGWTDVKVCRIDEHWSGLQFARRRGRS